MGVLKECGVELLGTPLETIYMGRIESDSATR